MPSDELQEEVFLTCRTLFAGPNAQLRRPKKVREVLQQHRHKILPLVNKHGLDNIADGARHLLEKGVFESNLRAKIQFPELFQLTPARGAQRTASENEAARSEAEALAEAEPIQGEEVEDREPLNEILTNRTLYHDILSLIQGY